MKKNKTLLQTSWLINEAQLDFEMMVSIGGVEVKQMVCTERKVTLTATTHGINRLK